MFVFSSFDFSSKNAYYNSIYKYYYITQINNSNKPNKTLILYNQIDLQMKNCIFCCVFTNINYVKMFYLLLESIHIYGDLDSNTDILIYTTTDFQNIIKQSHLYCDNIKFVINDDYVSISDACCARLDLFNFEITSEYSKILYLDTDIIVKANIKPLFELCQKDILYTLEEGTITSDTEYWGKTLFGSEADKYSDKTAFTSGILLFNTSIAIRDLFAAIRRDMNIRKKQLVFYDQPFIVFNAFHYNMYDNKILKDYAVNNTDDVQSTKIIHHFPGGPGVYGHKIEKMAQYLMHIRDATIVNNILQAKTFIDTYLMPIILESGEALEGNIFMQHHQTEYTNRFLLKAKNISNFVLNRNITKAMEIGFNSGFSTLLMLLSNPRLYLTCYDLGEHSYTVPCFNKLREFFGDRLQLILGDSTKTLPLASGKYQLIHIDGGHSTEVATSDIEQSYRLSTEGTILIMDDYDFPNLHKLWDHYIQKYNLANLNISVYDSPHHDARYIVTYS